MIGDKTAPDLPALRDDDPATLPQIEGLRALLDLTEPVTYPQRPTAAIPAVASPVPRRGSHRAQVPAQPHWRRLTTFGLVGAAVFLAGLGLQVGLVRLAGMSHLASYAVQTAVSIQLSYVLNRLITWRDRDVAPSSWLRFGLQQAVVQGLGVAGYAGLTRIGMQYVAANVAVTAVLAPAGYASGHLWSMTDRRGWLTRVGSRVAWPLFAVLAVQAVLSLRLIWSNTAYTDEALYVWAGHMEWQHWLHGTDISSLAFPRYFSGAPVVYPPVAALFDSAGGLALARILSLLFMAGATVLLWSVTRRLYTPRAAAYAAALFVLVGTGQDLGAFATYDAMAIFLLALAFWLGVRGAYARHPAASGALYVSCAAALSVADAAKYASALWDPVVIAAVAVTAWRLGRHPRCAVLPAAAVTGLLVLLLVGALKLAGHQYITGIEFTTTDRATGDLDYPVTTILWLGFTLTWIIILLSAAAVLYVRRGSLAERMFRVACLLGVFAPILNEARIHTNASLYKHVVFGAWFGAITAGMLLAQMTEVNPRKGWRAGAAVLVLAGIAGYGQGTAYFNYWPGTWPVVQELGKLTARSAGPMALQDQQPIAFYLSSRVSPAEVSNYPLAADVASGYYRYVELSTEAPMSGHWPDSESRETEAERGRLVARMDQANGYRLVYRHPWSDNWYTGEFFVWEYEGARQ